MVKTKTQDEEGKNLTFEKKLTTTATTMTGKKLDVYIYSLIEPIVADNVINNKHTTTTTANIIYVGTTVTLAAAAKTAVAVVCCKQKPVPVN